MIEVLVNLRERTSGVCIGDPFNISAHSVPRKGEYISLPNFEDEHNSFVVDYVLYEENDGILYPIIYAIANPVGVVNDN